MVDKPSERARKPRQAPTPTKSVPSVGQRREDHARRMLRRLMQGDSPPTAPMSIVERLAGSPYANPMIQVGGVDESARKTIDFALNLAETMFRYGAGALEVETSIIAVTAAFGLRNVDVDITNQSVIINYAKKDLPPVTLLRVVRSWTNNYAGLALVHQLVTEIVSGGVSRDEAAQRLHDIVRRPKPFPRPLVTLAEGIFALAIVGVTGGGPLASLVAFLSNILVSLLSRQLGRWRVPDFFTTAAGSFVVTFIALLFWWMNLPIAPGIVIAGGILLLLPSGRLVSAVQDAINGFPVTAAGRLLSAFLTFGAVVSGIAVGLVLGQMFGAAKLDPTRIPATGYPIGVLALLVVVAVLMIGISEQTSPKLLLPTGLVGLVGYAVLVLSEAAGVGDRLSPAVSAVAIGMVARMVALRLGAPQLVVAVPALLFLLPGLSIFSAMYTWTIDPNAALEGAVGIFNALTVILAIAGGIVLGDNLARPFTRKLGSNEKRRNRRR